MTDLKRKKSIIAWHFLYLIKDKYKKIKIKDIFLLLDTKSNVK